MFNNRMLAVAAVLVMAVPALGAATPIVVPPVPEQLVEGHTVFTVIEIVRATTTAEVRFAAAVAVLVREYQAERVARRFPGVLWFNDQYLVNPLQQRAAFDAFRYPCGGAVIAVNAGDPDPRVAIIRTNAGNPAVDVDGTNVVPANDFGVLYNGGIPSIHDDDFDSTNFTYRSSDNWWEPDPDYTGDGVDDPYYYGQDSGGPGDDPTDYAWVGAKPGDGTVNVDTTDPGADVNGNAVYSDTVIGAGAGSIDKALFNMTSPWDYDESYLITDPNDHSWVIDKYMFYTRDSVDGTNAHASDIDPATLDPDTFAGDRAAGSDNVNNLETKMNDPNTGAPPPSTEHFPTATWGGKLDTLYEYPVWVVNMLGSPVFIPDGGNAIAFGNEFLGENCMPFRDLLEDLAAPANGAACGLAVDNGNIMGTGADTDLGLSPGSPVAPFTDDPCMGYMEPSRNGYCYGGQDAADADLDGDVDKDDCLAERADGNQRSVKPLRLYNALLYFKLEDLRIEGEDKDHSDPLNNIDTNGCADEVHWWDTSPDNPQGDGNPNWVYNGDPNTTSYECPNDDDDLEGNSHSFHPSAPVHEEREDCIPEFAGPNPTNHGGSTYVTPADRASDAGWYAISAPCDYAHATRNIDIYFSGAGRPFPPVIRSFDVMDLEGSSAPFQDYHTAYPGP